MRRRRRLKRTPARYIPVRERTLGIFVGGFGLDVAHDDEPQPACPNLRAVEPQQVVACDPLDGIDGASGWTPVGMSVGIHQAHQAIHRHGRRIVFVLPDARDDRRPPSVDLLGRERGVPKDVRDDVEHRGQILGQAGARCRQQVTRHAYVQADAAAIEVFGQPLCRSAFGAAIDDARQEVRATKEVVLIEAAARRDGGKQRHCRMGRSLLDQHRRAAVERLTKRRQSPMDEGGHYALRPTSSANGSNHPTVRLVGAR